MINTGWRSDFFEILNELPAEAVDGIGHILDPMGTEPGFRAARRAMLQDLLEVGGPELRVTGIDPTQAFVDLARQRVAELDARNAGYELGDIRRIPAGDGEFDAAFCSLLAP